MEGREEEWKAGKRNGRYSREEEWKAGKRTGRPGRERVRMSSCCHD